MPEQKPKTEQPLSHKNAALMKRLLIITLMMFGFGFALVPLYDVFCDFTGINGKTSGLASAQSESVDEERWVTLEFVSSTAAGLPWEFKPEVKRIKLRAGETQRVNFLAHNMSSEAIVAQAIPSVTPGLAAQHLHKVECFCFNQQKLEGGERVEMPLQFYISPDLPTDISTLTLSYSLFKVEQDEQLTVLD